MKKSLAALALAACAFLPGCLGPNNAFNNLHAWNQKVTDNKWGNEAVFIGLNIIPVYGLCYLGDVLIFNSIEFWGGNNPIEASKK
jgi:hypothetical protein